MACEAYLTAAFRRERQKSVDPFEFRRFEDTLPDFVRYPCELPIGHDGDHFSRVGAFDRDGGPAYSARVEHA